MIKPGDIVKVKKEYKYLYSTNKYVGNLKVYKVGKPLQNQTYNPVKQFAFDLGRYGEITSPCIFEDYVELVEDTKPITLKEFLED